MVRTFKVHQVREERNPLSGTVAKMLYVRIWSDFSEVGATAQSKECVTHSQA